MRRVGGVADSATDGMELPPQRAKTGPARDPGLAARRRWVEENPLKPKPGLSEPPVGVERCRRFGRAPSRKAREGAHPLFLLCLHLTVRVTRRRWGPPAQRVQLHQLMHLIPWSKCRYQREPAAEPWTRPRRIPPIDHTTLQKTRYAPESFSSA